MLTRILPVYTVLKPQRIWYVSNRTGYVILLANCPLLWVSKLQSEIALSTIESEFIAQSSSFRSLIPTKRLIEATLSGLDIKTDVHYSAKSTFFEDNSGALGPATTKRLKVESAANKSDIFTKGLKPVDFIRIRKLLCGRWSLDSISSLRGSVGSIWFPTFLLTYGPTVPMLWYMVYRSDVLIVNPSIVRLAIISLIVFGNRCNSDLH